MKNRILVPLDGSELAECALNYVRATIKEGAAGAVTLLNVVNTDISWAKIGYSSYSESIDRIREEHFLSAKQYLSDLESKLGSEGIEAIAVVLKASRPAPAITDFARQNNMDMIVLATHGHTGLQKMMLGSVTLEVLHDAHVPVLVITPEACRA